MQTPKHANVDGLRYQNLKALLAYSSIWHQDGKDFTSGDHDKALG
jgi:hypothetical protein